MLKPASGEFGDQRTVAEGGVIAQQQRRGGVFGEVVFEQVEQDVRDAPFISLGLRRRQRVDGTSGTVGLLPAGVVASPPAKLAVRRHPMVAHGPRDGGRGALRAPHAGTGTAPSALAGIAAVLHGDAALQPMTSSMEDRLAAVNPVRETS